jgi:NTE family protein
VARLGCRQNPYPGGLFLLGKTVGILLSQSLDYELERVQTYNRLLTGGAETYGPNFAANLNAILGSHRNATYRPIRTCHLRPSKNINRMALEALDESPGELRVAGLPGRVLSRFVRSAVFAESDLLSTLMFTPAFVRALVDLGYRDAEARSDELVAFFD